MNHVNDHVHGLMNDAKLRPDSMWVDPEACIECGMCDEVSPGIRDLPGEIAVTSPNLEAMSVCPTGAIRWSEGEEDQ